MVPMFSRYYFDSPFFVLLLRIFLPGIRPDNILSVFLLRSGFRFRLLHMAQLYQPRHLPFLVKAQFIRPGHKESRPFFVAPADSSSSVPHGVNIHPG